MIYITSCLQCYKSQKVEINEKFNIVYKRLTNYPPEQLKQLLKKTNILSLSKPVNSIKDTEVESSVTKGSELLRKRRKLTVSDIFHQRTKIKNLTFYAYKNIEK